jgi:hypothetical protein
MLKPTPRTTKAKSPELVNSASRHRIVSANPISTVMFAAMSWRSALMVANWYASNSSRPERHTHVATPRAPATLTGVARRSRCSSPAVTQAQPSAEARRESRVRSFVAARGAILHGSAGDTDWAL